MAKIYKPPTPIELEDYIKHMVFLAGSIEMDTAENWQERISNKLVTIPDLTILNPRRDQWNSDWQQSITNRNFKEQVDWELDGINNSDTIIFYFDPNTKSPITLMELGIVSGLSTEKNVIICCPDGFWRKGNVDVLVSRMAHVNLIYCKTLDELINTSHEFLNYQLHLKDK
jgi:hypothetical protein